MTYIIKCTCKHEYQDSKYGTNNRIMNQTRTAPGTPPQARCTVCGNVKAVKE